MAELKIAKGRAKFEGLDPIFGYVKGTAKWAQVLKADEYGNYSISLYGKDVEELEEELSSYLDEAYEAVVAAGKKAVKADIFKVDQDGEKFIGFKLPETKYDGEPNSIKIYDVTGKLVEDWDKLIGNGSKVKIKYMVKPYYMPSTKMVGLSFRFYALQVLDLVEYSGGGDSGFTDESSSSAPFDTDNEDF